VTTDATGKVEVRFEIPAEEPEPEPQMLEASRVD
jgi:hypothetical protein